MDFEQKIPKLKKKNGEFVHPYWSVTFYNQTSLQDHTDGFIVQASTAQSAVYKAWSQIREMVKHAVDNSEMSVHLKPAKVALLN